MIFTMATNEKKQVKGESSTEAYEKHMEARSGACAADYWAGPGVNVPALDGKGVGGQKLFETSSDRLLERRVRNLERSARKKSTKKVRVKKTAKPKKSSPPGSPGGGDSDSVVDSSSDTSKDGSRSSSSGSSDGEGHSSSAKKSSKKKRTKYNRKHQLGRKPIKNADTLLVCLVKLLRKAYKKGKDVGGLIDHLLVMAEKTESGYYKLECLTGYDDDCRERANEEGIKSFGEINAATVLRFLSYDSTAAARKQSVSQTQTQGKKSSQRGYCFNFNSQSGCDGAGCNFRHVCMFCGDSTHGSVGCKRSKSSSGLKSKGN